MTLKTIRRILYRAGRGIGKLYDYWAAVLLYPKTARAPEGRFLSFWPGRLQRIGILARTLHKTHPCIEVMTEGGSSVTSRDEYVPCRVIVFGCPEEYAFCAPCRIRVRGHSTAEQGEEKPYRLRFEKRTSLLGLHGGAGFKSWVLLRTYHSLIPDYLAFHLYRTVSGGKYYCSDCAFVNLFLNQRPLGIYLLCEQNQAGKGRMEVHEPKKWETGTDIGYLLELDHYAGLEHPYFDIEEKPPVRDPAGESRPLYARSYSVKSKVRSEDQLEFIAAYVRGAYEILYQASVNGRAMRLDGRGGLREDEGIFESPFEAVCAVIDTDSLACMMILHEMVQNYDVGIGGLYLAADFSKDSRFPRLIFLGPWDFNWTFGENPDRGFYACTFQKEVKGDRSNGWYILAARMEGMQGIIREKWKALRAGGLLEEVLDRVSAECESLRPDLEGQEGKLAHAGRLIDFVKRRISFLDRQWL